MTLSLVLGIAGCVALLVGLFGGGIRVKEIEIPAISTLPRIFSAVIGIALIGTGIWTSPIDSVGTSAAAPTSTNIPASTPPMPLNTPPAITATPTSLSVPFEEIVDTTTVEYDMHACPQGFALGGANLNANTFLCRRVTRPGEEKFIKSVVDTSTVRSDMHACPSGMYLRGIHLGNNFLLCSYDQRQGPQEWTVEFVDSGTVINGIHVCPNDSNETRFLTGVRADQDEFLCATHTVP